MDNVDVTGLHSGQQQQGRREKGTVVSVRTPSNEWTAIEEDRVRTSWIGKLAARWWGRLLMAAVGWSAIAVMFSLPNLMTGGFDKELRMYFTQF